MISFTINSELVSFEGRGVGIASHFTFGGYAAHAVEVSGWLFHAQKTIARVAASYRYYCFLD